MGANTHIVLTCQCHCAPHDLRIGGMEAAGDIGAVDERHHLGIQAHGPGAEAFPYVAIE
jgi:hypothetical protein